VIIHEQKVISQNFDKVRQLQHTGVIVRAAHNRSLDSESERLWSKLEGQPISLEQKLNLRLVNVLPANKAYTILCKPPYSYRFDNRDLYLYMLFMQRKLIAQRVKRLRMDALQKL